MARKVKEEKGPQKKKSIAFNATIISNNDEEDEQEDDGEISLLVKNVIRMYQKVKFSNEDDKEEMK